MSDSVGMRFPRHTRWMLQVFWYLAAMAGLVWVFHGIHLPALWAAMQSINWSMVGLSILADIVSYIWQGVRWQVLLKPVGDLTVLQTTKAVFAGLFANIVLPMRLGELVRTYLISQWLKVDFHVVLPSLFIERFIDGLMLAAAVWLVIILVPLPPYLMKTTEILGVVVIISTIFFLYAVMRKDFANDGFSRKSIQRSKPVRLVFTFFRQIIQGVHEIGTSRYFFMAFTGSLFYVLFQIISFWLLILSLNIHVSIWIGSAVFLIVYLGTAVPNTPSNMGTFQFLSVAGLTLFGVDKTIATGFSLFAFVIVTVPIWILGLFAISRSGMTMVSIKNEIYRIKELSPDKPPAPSR
jgi:glycosyltransferase 2 family protein